jgi:uncharacterized protein RhaS with RHS repeats
LIHVHYNRYRYYDPGVGRFVSQDPIGLRGGSNPFMYAPNPNGWVDPLGLAKGKCACEINRDTHRLKQVNIYLIQRHLPKGAAGPLACSVHDPAGSLVVVNTKQPSITLTFTGVSISNPARCSQ